MDDFYTAWTLAMKYDVIIVGGGLGGATLGRLSLNRWTTRLKLGIQPSRSKAIRSQRW
jgi:hypothetical protein